ncbi:hypothetical protein LSTR_LSTR016968, partial [Laodelphax striatellus]
MSFMSVVVYLLPLFILCEASSESYLLLPPVDEYDYDDDYDYGLSQSNESQSLHNFLVHLNTHRDTFKLHLLECLHVDAFDDPSCSVIFKFSGWRIYLSRLYNEECLRKSARDEALEESCKKLNEQMESNME